MSDTPFEYETLVENALRGVVKKSLEQLNEFGAIDDHHFFITFFTNHPGVKIPEYLLEKYPEEMTIVLQHQFEDLFIKPDHFGVTLSFNNVPEPMVIPFDAVTGFADPSVKFGLQFQVSIEAIEELDIDDLEEYLAEEGEDFVITDTRSDDNAESDEKSSKKSKPAKKGEKDEDQDNVVSLDHFRKN